jgi:hypothetical protein
MDRQIILQPTDIAGNGNSPASASFSVVYDNNQIPGVSLSTSASNPANGSPIPLTITFTEEVTGFSSTEITVGNGSAANLQTTDNIVFTADITPAGSNVTVTADIGAGVVQDLAGNGNTAADQFMIYFDNTQPTAGITCSEPDPADNYPFDVTITFSETVTGFASGDIVAGNGSVTAFSAVTSQVFIADWTKRTFHPG